MDKQELISAILAITESAAELDVAFSEDDARMVDQALTDIQRLCESES